MRLPARILASLAIVMTACACTTTFAAKDEDLPGYKPTLSEAIGHWSIFNDMQNKDGFAQLVCKGIAPKKPATPEKTSTTTATTDLKTKLHLEVTADGKPQFSADASFDPQKPQPNLQVTLPAAAKTNDKATAGKADEDGGANSGLSTCAYRVITAAINVCARRLNSRNILSKLENTGVAQIVALSGATAGIATLAGASGKTTTLLTTGAAVASTLATGMQKVIPDPQKVALDEMIKGGKTYASLGDNDPGDPGTGGPDGTQQSKIRLLFDVTFSACPITG